jgi:hypothetical protein
VFAFLQKRCASWLLTQTHRHSSAVVRSSFFLHQISVNDSSEHVAVKPFCTIPMPCKRMLLSSKMTCIGNGEELTSLKVVLSCKRMEKMYGNYG